MKIYQVSARMIEVRHLSLDIEAESAEAALEIAKQRDGADFDAGRIEEDWIWGEAKEKETEAEAVTCYSELIELAESYGFVDNYPEGEDWNPTLADALAEEALDYLQSKGVEVIFQDY